MNWGNLCGICSLTLFTALLYELLYTRVLGIAEEDLHVTMEGFRGGGQRCRNSLSLCSDDAGYDALEDGGPRSAHTQAGIQVSMSVHFYTCTKHVSVQSTHLPVFFLLNTTIALILQGGMEV